MNAPKWAMCLPGSASRVGITSSRARPRCRRRSPGARACARPGRRRRGPGIGLSSIFWRFKKNKYQDKWQHGWHGHHGHHGRCGRDGDWTTSSTTTSEDENEVVVVDSTFGEQIKYIRSTNLKKVQISSSFSSVKVFFDGCTVSPEGLTIMVDCNFSGIVLNIPRTWNIDNQTRSAFGSVDGAILSSGDYTQVTLVGDVHFGGAKINYL